MREGERILGGLYPAGALTHRLSDKHSGLLTSPRFKVETDFISVRALGGGGAMVRLIVDNYPLGSNPIFPKAVLEKDEPGWLRLDTAYRKGSYAYLEVATRDDLTRPIPGKDKSRPPVDGRSHFGIGKIVFHDGKDAPKEAALAVLPLLEGPAPRCAAELAAVYERVLAGTIGAWRENRLSEPERAFLDFFVRRELLPATLSELETARPLVLEYRRLEAEAPVAQRAPGVLETVAFDAPFLPRGEHLKPGDPVPRGYLEVLGSRPYQTPFSGRLELAHEIGAREIRLPHA